MAMVMVRLLVWIFAVRIETFGDDKNWVCRRIANVRTGEKYSTSERFPVNHKTSSLKFTFSVHSNCLCFVVKELLVQWGFSSGGATNIPPFPKMLRSGTFEAFIAKQLWVPNINDFMLTILSDYFLLQDPWKTCCPAGYRLPWNLLCWFCSIRFLFQHFAPKWRRKYLMRPNKAMLAEASPILNWEQFLSFGPLDKKLAQVENQDLKCLILMLACYYWSLLRLRRDTHRPLVGFNSHTFPCWLRAYWERADCSWSNH